MYDVRISRDGVLSRQKIETLPAVSVYLRSLSGDYKIVGVFEISVSDKGVTTSREIPCFVEGDLVVLGKPM